MMSDPAIELTVTFTGDAEEIVKELRTLGLGAYLEFASLEVVALDGRPRRPTVSGLSAVKGGEASETRLLLRGLRNSLAPERLVEIETLVSDLCEMTARPKK